MLQQDAPDDYVVATGESISIQDFLALVFEQLDLDWRQLEENEEALQNLIFQKSMQQLEDLSQIKKVKKKISRIKTIIHEKELNIEIESDN